MLTLGVPTLRRYDLLELLLASAREGDRKPDECVIVDNGGLLGHRSWIESDMYIVRPGRNLGVAASWNEIMRRANGEHVLLVGDDVRLHKNTLSALEQAAIAGAGFARAATEHPFPCFVLARWMWEKVGPFDERFWPAYFEDNDYHRRMKLLGYDFTAVAGIGYDHVGSATIKSFNEAELSTHHAQFNANRDRYVAKWGGLPGSETVTDPGGR